MIKKVITVVCAFALILSMGVSAFADTGNRPTIENRVEKKIPAALMESVKTMQKYISLSADGIMSFDEVNAIAAGEGEKIIELGRSLVAFSIAMQMDPAEAIRQAVAGFPVYGNWCGPGHSGPGNPIDSLDTLCKTHDNCYAAAWKNNPSTNGKQICSCDQALMNSIANAYAGFNSGQQQVADMIFDYFFLTQWLCV